MEELRNFSLESKASIQTDFAAGADCYQKVVRFCYDGSMLVTGGMEGVVRVWKVSMCMWGREGGCVCVGMCVCVPVNVCVCACECVDVLWERGS